MCVGLYIITRPASVRAGRCDDGLQRQFFGSLNRKKGIVYFSKCGGGKQTGRHGPWSSWDPRETRRRVENTLLLRGQWLLAPFAARPRRESAEFEVGVFSLFPSRPVVVARAFDIRARQPRGCEDFSRARPNIRSTQNFQKNLTSSKDFHSESYARFLNLRFTSSPMHFIPILKCRTQPE